MKPRKVTRRVVVTSRDDMRDRLTVAVTVDDTPPNVAPADRENASANPPVTRRARKPRRGGTNQRKAPP